MKDNNKAKLCFSKGFFLKNSTLYCISLVITIFIGYIAFFNTALAVPVLRIIGITILTLFVSFIIYGILLEIRDRFGD